MDRLPEVRLTETDFGELVILVNELQNDAHHYCLRLDDTDHPDRCRRQFARTFFAAIEGTVWTFKRLALSRHYSGAVALSAGEIAALREEAFRIERSGGVGVEDMRTPFLPNFLFAFRVVAATYEFEYNIPTGDAEYERFQACARIRDRLTHPKRLIDLQITDSETDALKVAYKWFWEHAITLMNRLPASQGGN